jgi:hypothetical protein
VYDLNTEIVAPGGRGGDPTSTISEARATVNVTHLIATKRFERLPAGRAREVATKIAR